MADEESVPRWWIVLFLLLALGGAAVVVYSVGGSLVTSPGVLAPLAGLH
ncbi:MAG: hypothetical protein ABEJ22_03055 [Haloferacaceae archaeon]